MAAELPRKRTSHMQTSCPSAPKYVSAPSSIPNCMSPHKPHLPLRPHQYQRSSPPDLSMMYVTRASQTAFASYNALQHLPSDNSLTILCHRRRPQPERQFHASNHTPDPPKVPNIPLHTHPKTPLPIFLFSRRPAPPTHTPVAKAPSRIHDCVKREEELRSRGKS